MDAASAVMVLLMCSNAGADCMEIRSDRTYESASVCRHALPTVVAKLNRDGRTVSGRCALAAEDEARPRLDPIVTCSTTGDPGTATVRVTRMSDGQAVTNEWVVPKAKPQSCG
jgi:hypothetical protein